MHIKQSYEQRRKAQEAQQRSAHRPKDHSTTIGSIHTGTVNYALDQPFFIDYKMRDSVREAKQAIKQLKDADIMGIKDKEWNASVAAPTKFDDFEKEESHKSKLLKIKLGFTDFSPIKEKPNKVYPGTETRDNLQNWNVSTYVDKSQKKQGLQFTNVNAIQNTIRYNSSKLSGYKSLKQRYNETVSLNRSEIMNNSDIIEDLKQSFVFTYPNSSPEKAYASAMKMYDEVRREKIRQEMVMKEENSTQSSLNTSKFRASLSPTQKLKIQYIHFHTGCWRRSPQPANSNANSNVDSDDEGGYYWTCCLNEGKDSKGCSYRVQDGNKMNLSSYNHA